MPDLFARPRVEALSLFAAGLLSVRGFAPHGDLLSFTLGFWLLFHRLPRHVPRRAAWLAWCFGLGHFTLGFSWVTTSLHQFGHIPLPVTLFMLLALAGTMALYPALTGYLAAHLPAATRPLALPFLWIGGEWLRMHLFTGFPWNLSGYVLAAGGPLHDALLQTAFLGGLPLLSLLALLPSALLAWAGTEWKKALWAGGVIVITWGGGSLWGGQRLADHPTEAPRWRIALVQGNIRQDLKWDQSQEEANFQTYLALTRAIGKPVDLVVWPETAVTFFLQLEKEKKETLTALVRDVGAPLLTGTPMVTFTPGRAKGYEVTNSLLLLEGDGRLHRRYDKHHLVPFGEFVPFRAFLPDSVEKLTQGAGDFQPGPGPLPLIWRRGRLGPLICYEAIFPEEVAELAQHGIDLLVNVTNDGWFGEDALPQHLAMARTRVVESGRPMIRVANTGISAAFDPLGRELGRLASGVRGSLVVGVPGPLP